MEIYYTKWLLGHDHMFIVHCRDLHLYFFGFAASEGIGPIKPSAESSLSSSYGRFVLSDMVRRLYLTMEHKIRLSLLVYEIYNTRLALSANEIYL